MPLRRDSNKRDLDRERDELTNDFNKNKLKNHCKPPDSTNDPIADDHANKNNECTICDSPSNAVPYTPAKRSKKKDLDLEHDKLEEEFNKIFNSPQATLDQLHRIYLKWLIHQYKRIHWLCALGGDNCESYCHAALQCQLEYGPNDYHDWLEKLAAYSMIHDIAVTINGEDIEDAKVLDSLQTGAAMFDDQVGWVTAKAPAFFALLQTHAKDRANGVVSCEQFEKTYPFMRALMVQLLSSPTNLQLQRHQTGTLYLLMTK